MHEVIYALPPELAAVSTLSTSTQFGKNRPLTIRSVAKRPSANAAVAHIACPMVTPIFQKFMIDSIDWASTMCTVFISRAELIITNRVDHMHRSLSQARRAHHHHACSARSARMQRALALLYTYPGMSHRARRDSNYCNAAAAGGSTRSSSTRGSSQ